MKTNALIFKSDGNFEKIPVTIQDINSEIEILEIPTTEDRLSALESAMLTMMMGV